MTGRAQSVVFDDGATSTLEFWGTGGPLVLCVHGMTSSRLSWTRLAERFSGRLRIAAYDQRGHGDSATIAGPMTLVRGVRDVQEVCKAVGEPVHALLGHSWGGAIVIRGGRTLPVDRVAAIDPMIRQCDDAWYVEYIDELREQFSLRGSARDDAVRAEYSEWSPDDVEGKVHAVHAMNVGAIEALWKQNPVGDWDLRADVRDYDKPLLLAMADRSTSINGRETIEQVERDHARAVEIAEFQGAGHNLHRTHFPEVASALERFLLRP